VHLVVVGVSHKTAPLELRARLALGDEEATRFARRLLEHDSVAEALALSTCNRAELYLFADDTLAAEQLALTGLAGLADTTVADLRPSVYSFSGDAAIAHLFRVSASLDSMVVGEAQILAQIKDAYQNACGSGCTSTVFNKLFRHALEVGKRVRSETSIGERPVSVSSAAVELARQVLGKLDDRTVLVIGAGETSELTARHLRAHGASRILVANRTLAAAEQLAAQCGGAAVAFEALDEHLREADIVISSTSSPGYVLDRARVAAALHRRRRGPVFMIDIAVPRDLDPEIEHVDDVFLYDIDDLKGVVERNRAEREREAERAERIVAEELAKMDEWLAGLEVVPTIALLRSAVDGIREGELQRLGARLDDLTPHQREQVELLTTSIVNKILHMPTVRMKELAGERDSYVYVDALRQLFGLDGLDGAAPAADPPAADSPATADPPADGCDPCSLGDEVPDATHPTRKVG
jgi:glutamyl-tRNA reductase